MTAQSQPGADKAAEKKSMTAAEAAKRVKRTVTVQKKDEGGKVTTTTKQVSVDASEVLSFKDYDTHVVVVTRDGQKLSSAEA